MHPKKTYLMLMLIMMSQTSNTMGYWETEKSNSKKTDQEFSMKKKS